MGDEERALVSSVVDAIDKRELFETSGKELLMRHLCAAYRYGFRAAYIKATLALVDAAVPQSSGVSLERQGTQCSVEKSEVIQLFAAPSYPAIQYSIPPHIVSALLQRVLGEAYEAGRANGAVAGIRAVVKSKLISVPELR